MDIIMIAVYLFVIFLCGYSIYILGQMKTIVDSMSVQLGRMSETLKKNDE
jgi:hypothetical protein|tara:strand:+ start:320 stop:469 length:150 start_codon:yes stop_codon:yes gene_type:complete